MEWTGNPVRDEMRYTAMIEKESERYPVCDICGKTIYDDYYYDILGERFCPECLSECYEKSTDKYLERGYDGF